MEGIYTSVGNSLGGLPISSENCQTRVPTMGRYRALLQMGIPVSSKGEGLVQDHSELVTEPGAGLTTRRAPQLTLTADLESQDYTDRPHTAFDQLL